MVVTIEFGKNERSPITAVAVPHMDGGAGGFMMFKIDEIDSCWRDCVAVLEVFMTSSDLLR